MHGWMDVCGCRPRYSHQFSVSPEFGNGNSNITSERQVMHKRMSSIWCQPSHMHGFAHSTMPANFTYTVRRHGAPPTRRTEPMPIRFSRTHPASIQPNQMAIVQNPQSPSSPYRSSHIVGVSANPIRPPVHTLSLPLYDYGI